MGQCQILCGQSGGIDRNMLCRVKPEPEQTVASNTDDEYQYVFILLHVYRLLKLFFSVTLS